MSDLHTYEVLCTDLSRVELQARSDRAAAHEAFRAAGAVGKVVFSVLPKGCTGLSPTAHVGRFCPVHDA
jgi:hypothetical protein